jgi:hypothetical protein
LVNPETVTGEVGGEVDEEAKAHPLNVEPSVETARSYFVKTRPPLNAGSSKAIEREAAPCVDEVIVGADGIVPPPK